MNFLGGVPDVPLGENATVFADWAELFVLGSGKPLKRGDLKSVLARASDGDPDTTADSIWSELEQRARVMGATWGLTAKGDRFHPKGARLEAYVNALLAAMCVHGPGVHRTAAAVFELLVAELVADVSQGSAQRFIGTTETPARQNSSGTCIRAEFTLPGPANATLWLAGWCCRSATDAVSALARGGPRAALQMDFVAVPEFLAAGELETHTTTLRALLLDRSRILALACRADISGVVLQALKSVCTGLYA